MPNVYVSYDELVVRAEELQAAHDELKSILTHVNALSDSAVRAGSGAWPRFLESQEQLSRGAKEALTGVEVMVTQLRQAADAYQALDAEAGKAFS